MKVMMLQILQYLGSSSMSWKNIVLMKRAHKCVILHGTSTGDLFMKVKETPKALKPKWEALKVDKQMLKMYGCCCYWSYYQLHVARKLSVFMDKSLYYLYSVQLHWRSEAHFLCRGHNVYGLIHTKMWFELSEHFERNWDGICWCSLRSWNKVIWVRRNKVLRILFNLKPLLLSFMKGGNQ